MCALILAVAAAGGYSDLVTLFGEWRAFQKPALVDGVPDYTPAAMARQHAGLKAWQKRLASLDPRAWPVPQQVDWHILRAEMNGLDFDHRVLQPWARNPDFYVTVFTDETDQPAREGPHALGGVEVFRFTLPRDAGELARRLSHIPALLQQARGNLTGNARDLWLYGIRDVKAQHAALADLARKASGHAALTAAVQKALDATDGFLQWLEAQAPSKTGPSGVGVENYDWYLANVQLVRYRWADEVLLMERELARARATLLLEEQKNRALPPQAAGVERGGARAPLRRRRQRVHEFPRPARRADHPQGHGPGAAQPRWASTRLAARWSSSPRWTTATRR